jgi:cell division protein FtsX
MTLKLLIVALMTAVLLATVCYFLVKNYVKMRGLYEAEAEKNSNLEDEIGRMKQMEGVKNEARKETESRVNEVDSLSGVDKFNAINDVLSDNG